MTRQPSAMRMYGITCSTEESGAHAWHEACDDASGRVPEGTRECAKSRTAGAPSDWRVPTRLQHVGSNGRQKQPFGASSVDHLSRPDQLVGAEFPFGDAIAAPHVGRWRLPDADGNNSPCCRHPRPSDHSACGVTADLVARLRADRASPETARAWRGPAGSGQIEEGRHRSGRYLQTS